MVRLEVSQGSFPVQNLLFSSLKQQVELIDGIYDGIEAHLTNGVSTRQLLGGNLGPEKSFVTGLHQSARTERLGRDLEKWPKSLFAWAYWLAMRHRFDSLPLLNQVAKNVGMPDIPTVLYPSKSGVELGVVTSNRLFQPKIEVIRMFNVADVNDWRRVLEEDGRWAGLCFDTQHSSQIIPRREIVKIRKFIERVHVSVGRTDLESADTRISLSPLITETKDDVLYPQIMELILQPDKETPFVVESGRMALLSSHKWRELHRQIAGTLRKWMG